MPAFIYRAVDPEGKTTKGLLDAESEAAVRADLRKRNLLPLSVKTARSRGNTASVNEHQLSLKKQVLIIRQMATLVGAQVRIEDAIRIIADQLGNTRDTTLLLDLRAAIIDGLSFSDALDKMPGGFDEYFRASVCAGESAGKLGHVLEYLASHIEERARNRQTLQLALIYPALLLVVSVGVIVALLTFVVPDIVRVFTARGADLPVLTRALISISDWLQRWGISVAVTLSLTLIGCISLLRLPQMRMRWDRALIQLPIIRHLVVQANAAQFSGTLATLVQSGVPLADALKAASGTVPNHFIRSRVAEITRNVQDGVSLARAVQAAQVFPPMLVAMIASGEAGSTLGTSLDSAAKNQAASLKATVSTIVALVEPAVLLIMGGIVMLLVMSILMPIVGLNELAQ